MKSLSIACAAACFLLLLSCKKETEDEMADGRNRWDGVYTVTGTMADVSVGNNSLFSPADYEFITRSENEVELMPRELGIPGILILSGTTLSYYGSFSIIVTFDRLSNKITSVRNGYGQPSPNGRYAILDPAGENQWDPATKTAKIRFWMDQPVVVAGHRVSFVQTWTYKSEREE
jgi:hypothetical protein